MKKANLYRQRTLYHDSLIDLASNDYLGLAEDFEIFDKAVSRVRNYRVHSPKASQLVNGYHPIHFEFENYLKWTNGFESAMVVGSGFLANLSLIEALPRKKDILILDEAYHASGILASKLLACPVHFFRHNDAGHLREILESHSYERAIVAVEGIYSMSGDILEREIFTVCALDKVIMIVDEAHSAGVLGDDFLGVFSHYDITPQPNHIKMGTLGKALGSYGAYILASEETISFLQNRAKAIVYATAPSLFDIALGHEAFLKIETSVEGLKVLREARIMCAKTFFDKKIEGLILPIEVSDKQKLLSLRDAAQEEGFVIGAIRPPTVDVAMLRIILRLNTPLEEIERLLGFIKQRAS